MKLLHIISIRLLALTALVLALWAFFFYRSIMQEISNEADEALREYAESIIIQEENDEALPTRPSGSNNQFFIREVTEEYAISHEKTRFEDRDIYVEETKEYEPARVYTCIYKDTDDKWQEIEVSTPHVDKEDLRNVIFSWLVFLLTAIMIAIVVVNIWVVRYSMREFVKLNETVAESMSRSEQLFEQQKQFIGNAAHELQTPIAICQNRLEMMLDDDTLKEQQIEELGKTLQTLGNLSRLNRSLLLLSKIENGQFNDTKRIDLSEQLTQLLTDYKEVYTHKNIAVDMQIKEPFIVKMDESLSSILLSNLLKNAYIHNIDGGKISINMSRNELRISNTGSYVPLDEKKVFNRFYTSGKKSSTGLGLSIVKAICAQYNLYIRYRFGEGRHHFIVRA